MEKPLLRHIESGRRDRYYRQGPTSDGELQGDARAQRIAEYVHATDAFRIERVFDSIGDRGDRGALLQMR